VSKDITILYVEDEEDVQENTKRPLIYLCDRILLAKDGAEGLELYKKHVPDIVVSDINMPIMNGIEMAKKIKQINQEQYIVFTTAHNESSYFIEAIEMQVDGYILKPIDYDILEEKIKKIKQQIELKYRLKEQEILTNEIAKLQENLLVVLDKDRNMIFSNDNFLNFFELSTLDKFRKKHNCLANVFVENEDSFVANDTQDWIEQIKGVEEHKKIVTMINTALLTPQTFLVSYKFIKKTAHTILSFTEITQISIEKREFKTKAFRDELTSIYNRAFFNQELTKQINLSVEENKTFCLIMFDVDKFKNFNDTYGHQVGDKILKMLVKEVKQNIRITDTLARWGGEEFIIILPETSLTIAKDIAEKLRVSIQTYKFVNDLSVTCSFGVYEFEKNDTEESIVKRIDTALYCAKENGRNRVEVYQGDGICKKK